MNPVLNENIIIHVLSFLIPPVCTIKNKYEPSDYFDEEKRKCYRYNRVEQQQSYKFSKYAKGYELDTLLDNPEYINLIGLCENTEDKAVDYVILLRKTDYDHDIQFRTVNFPSNPNPKAVEYTLRHRTKFNLDRYFLNTNDDVVNELISRIFDNYKNQDHYKNFMDDYPYCMNTNPIMVNWIIENKYILHNKLFLSNSSDIAVQYILNNTSFIIDHLKITFSYFIACLCKNENDMAIEYVLKYPQHIEWQALSNNKCPKAVEYILRPENIDKNNLSSLSNNENEKVVRFLLQKENQHLIDKHTFQLNPELLNYICVFKEPHYNTVMKYFKSIV
jgi:hypothetical protein